MHELKLQASDETLYTVLGEIEKLLGENPCPETLKMVMLVAGEETVVNIRDKGVPDNPLQRADPDITLSAEERQIGGLGIYMVKQSMAKVEYRYEDGYNILTIEKCIDGDLTTED